VLSTSRAICDEFQRLASSISTRVRSGSHLATIPGKGEEDMKLNDTARLLIGSAPATLVTVNRNGGPQVSVVWMVVQSTADGDDELVVAHLRST
jgi:hypothetical protein